MLQRPYLETRLSVSVNSSLDSELNPPSPLRNHQKKAILKRKLMHMRKRTRNQDPNRSNSQGTHRRNRKTQNQIVESYKQYLNYIKDQKNYQEAIQNLRRE